MAQIQEIQFVDADTGAPLVTVTGEKAQILVQHSMLIHHLIEGLSNTNRARPFLVVPIGGFPADRRALFIKILKGIPVGTYKGYGNYTFYPLGEKEEKHIKNYIASSKKDKNKNKNKSTTTTTSTSTSTSTKINAPAKPVTLNEEREKVILQTLDYLMIPDTEIGRFIELDDVKWINVPGKKPISQDDRIKQMLDDHIYWLYSTYQFDKLTEEESMKAKAYFDQIKQEYDERKKNIADYKKRQKGMTRKYRQYTNNSDDEEDYLDNKYNTLINPEQWQPVDEDHTRYMNSSDYERYLHSIYFNNKRKNLPEQAYNLNFLFNKNRNNTVKKGTRKNTNAQNNNNNNKKNKAGAGAW